MSLHEGQVEIDIEVPNLDHLASCWEEEETVPSVQVIKEISGVHMPVVDTPCVSPCYASTPKMSNPDERIQQLVME